MLSLAHQPTLRNMHGLKAHLAMCEEVNAGQTIGPDLTVASRVFNQHNISAEKILHSVRLRARRLLNLIKR